MRPETPNKENGKSKARIVLQVREIRALRIDSYSNSMAATGFSEMFHRTRFTPDLHFVPDRIQRVIDFFLILLVQPVA